MLHAISWRESPQTQEENVALNKGKVKTPAKARTQYSPLVAALLLGAMSELR